MHMRHTERIASFKGSDGNYASTSLGKEAAAEFGSTLPKHREYIDYSTPTLTEHVRPLRRYAMVLWDPVEELSSVERSVPILHWIGKPF
jgi:hypothetical protein